MGLHRSSADAAPGPGATRHGKRKSGTRINAATAVATTVFCRSVTVFEEAG